MITREDIVDLANQKHDACISIYLPTHKMGEEVQQDPIRLKNLLNDAKEQLEDHEIPEQQIDQLLNEPKNLLDQPRFWQHNDKGLALFISKDQFEYYRIPHSFKERLMVGTHFLITPLVPMISKEGTFCMLTLSQKNIRLLKCTRNKVETIELQEAPLSMEEFKKYDEYQKSIGQSSSSNKQSMFHGWGDAALEQNAIENYLKTVENEVTSILRKRNEPLVLTGVSEAVAVYKNVNHYSRLMDESIIENPDPKSNTEIKDAGWKVIESFFLQDMYDDVHRFGDLTGSDKQSNNLTQIVEAAYYGKIDSLFVPVGEHSWGWFDQERDVVHHSTEQKNGEHDLINMSAIKTLTQSGNVYALDKDDMPDGSSVAAIFRYS